MVDPQGQSPRTLSDLSCAELIDALSDAKERVDLSQFVDSQGKADKARAELDAVVAEYRRRKANKP